MYWLSKICSTTELFILNYQWKKADHVKKANIPHLQTMHFHDIHLPAACILSMRAKYMKNSLNKSVSVIFLSFPLTQSHQSQKYYSNYYAYHYYHYQVECPTKPRILNKICR